MILTDLARKQGEDGKVTRAMAAEVTRVLRAVLAELPIRSSVDAVVCRRVEGAMVVLDRLAGQPPPDPIR